LGFPITLGDIINTGVMLDEFKEYVGREIRLVDGFYQTEDGSKISQNYYVRLWNEARSTSFLVAEEVLDNDPSIPPDPRGKPGFYLYEANNLEMVFNPDTVKFGIFNQ